MTRDIPTLLIRPQKQIIYISIKAENVSEIVDKIFEIINNFKIDVSEATVTTDFVLNEKRISFFADFSHATLSDVNIFVSMIRKIKGVKEVRTSDPLMTGVAIADIEFPVTTLGGLFRAIILPEPLFSGLIRGIIKNFGPTGLLFLYEAGKEMGIRESELLKKFSVSLDKLIEGFLKVLKSLGLLNPIGFEIKGDLITVRFRDCIECQSAAGLVGDNPSANLVRGLIDGFLENLTGKIYLSTEISCQYKGSDYCEIQSKPRA